MPGMVFWRLLTYCKALQSGLVQLAAPELVPNFTLHCAAGRIHTLERRSDPHTLRVPCGRFCYAWRSWHLFAWNQEGRKACRCTMTASASELHPAGYCSIMNRMTVLPVSGLDDARHTCATAVSACTTNCTQQCSDHPMTHDFAVHCQEVAAQGVSKLQWKSAERYWLSRRSNICRLSGQRSA